MKVYITEKGERHAKTGHPWVYESDVCRECEPVDGELCDVFSVKEKYIGTGFYNSASKIRVRIVTTNANDTVNEAFWRRRVKYALDYRKAVMGADFPASRLIFGESDGFPGLTVDLFEDVLCAESLCLGLDRVKGVIFDELVRLLPEYGITVKSVYERNDVAIRSLEGMELYKGFWAPERFPERKCVTVITENGIKYEVDCENGQKTGFFLDQKYNRLAAAKIAKGRRVLDCFTHTGAFALNCAAGGAAYVNAVDISKTAIAQTERNAELNGLKIDTTCADVFDLLTAMLNEKRHDYDYIILDPPAFTKSSATVKDAYRGYKDINYRAMRILPRGGFLATASCSRFMTADLFYKMLDEAAHDANISLKQIECRAQAPDHPVLRCVPDSAYLKFALFQIV